jgi:hypothetical protein
MTIELNLSQDNILEEYLGTDYTGSKYTILKSGCISKISLKKPYKSIKELFKVCNLTNCLFKNENLLKFFIANFPT